MPGTAVKEAIKNWEAANEGQSITEAKIVKLYAQIPPIEKMDDNLNTLESCEHLALSTNAIERMMPLSKLKNLRILSLARNQIKRIMGLDEVGNTLEELWLSYNNIEKLDGLQPCLKLHTLFLSNNKIRSWDEVGKLSQLPEIKNLLLVGNACYGDREKEENHPYVAKKVPQIQNVDGDMIDDTIRKAGAALDI